MVLVTCSQCGCACKPGRPNGSLTTFCSQGCRRAFRRAYERNWREANRESRRDSERERLKRWREANPDYFKKHYVANREHKKQLRRKWYEQNTERAQAQMREYAKRNPDLIRVLSRKSALNRRARLLEAFIEAVDPQTVFTRDKGVCRICGKSVAQDSNWEVDHVVPLSKGGVHAYSNVQLAHRRCNRKKGARVA